MELPYRNCKYVGCTNLTQGKYCEEHQEVVVKRYDNRASASKRGYNYKWQRYARSYLLANPLCVSCMKRGIVNVANVVDHTTPHKGNAELFWDIRNHQGLCFTCHNQKTAKEDMGTWDTHKGLN